MIRLSKNAPCVCGSGRKAKGCCGAVLEGAPAASAEALMRSRYTAYATGNIAYILNTTHPSSPHCEADRGAWARSVRAFSEGTVFVGLDVEFTATSGETAVVQFYARLERDGADVSFRERSRFQCTDGRWLYLDGQPESPAG